MQNLFLRKSALEADGWRSVRFGLSWALISPSGPRPEAALYLSENDVWQDAPAVESDPGVSEPWFLEWCAKRAIQWNISSTQSGRAVVVLFIGDANSNDEVNVSGATPSEARAKCVLAAATRSK